MNKVAAYKALIGPTHQDYYLSYFQRAEERGYAPISWHWPVFFIALMWLLWRKQYTWAFITLAVIVAAQPLAFAIQNALNIEGLAQGIHSLIVGGYGLIYLPMKANALYFNWATTTVAHVQAQLPGQEAKQLETLARLGGTNANVPIAFIVILLIISVLAGQPPELASQ